MSDTPINLHADTCPACGADKKGRVLTCASCWFKVPAKDRGSFYSMYHAARTTKDMNPQKACASKAEKIVRELKAKLATQAQ
ncbi:MAG: hypothetical protein JSR30_00250 [Proteobacteria bacterium]|nr:hypothetical protein [Pseudomonadota bacterium]